MSEIKCPACINVNHKIFNVYLNKEVDSIKEHDKVYECRICGHIWVKGNK